MTPEIEQRRFPRMSTSAGTYGVRFLVGEIEVRDARLANLSAGGCGLEVQMAQAPHLETGTVLEGLILDHPDLPFVPLRATILRLLGKVPGKTSGYLLAGVEFQDITPFVQKLIAEHVASQLARE